MRLARRKSRGGTHHNAPGNRISTSLGCILAGVEGLSTTRRAHKSFVQLIRFNNQIRKLKLFWVTSGGVRPATQLRHLSAKVAASLAAPLSHAEGACRNPASIEAGFVGWSPLSLAPGDGITPNCAAG